MRYKDYILFFFDIISYSYDFSDITYWGQQAVARHTIFQVKVKQLLRLHKGIW